MNRRSFISRALAGLAAAILPFHAASRPTSKIVIRSGPYVMCFEALGDGNFRLIDPDDSRITGSAVIHLVNEP